MRKNILLLCLIGLVSTLLFSCSRTSQIESLSTEGNKKALAAEIGRKDEQSKLALYYIIKEKKSFSPRAGLESFIDNTLTRYYSFVSDELSEHQKILIDEFIKETVKGAPKLARVVNLKRTDLILVAYIRSYSTERYLHFDVYDYETGEQTGNIKYKMSKISNSFEQK